MDEEPPDAHLIWDYIIHPSLLPLRLIIKLITAPLSLLLSAVLLPLRIIFLPLTSSFSILFTTRSSANPPGPVQFLASALFFGTVAGLILYLFSRLISMAIGTLDPADFPLSSAASQRMAHPLVPSARQVQSRIVQQVRQAQEVQNVKDATSFAKSLVPEGTPRGRDTTRTSSGGQTSFGIDTNSPVQPINVKREPQNQSEGIASSIDVWEDKWRRQQADRGAALASPFSLASPRSSGAGSGLGSPGAQRSASGAANLSQTIAEEDSDEMFWDTDEA